MARPRRTKPASQIDDALIDQLLAGRSQGPGPFSEDGLIGELKKRFAERMLATELDVHWARKLPLQRDSSKFDFGIC